MTAEYTPTSSDFRLATTTPPNHATNTSGPTFEVKELMRTPFLEWLAEHDRNVAAKAVEAFGADTVARRNFTIASVGEVQINLGNLVAEMATDRAAAIREGRDA